MNSKGSPLWPASENHPPAEMLFLSLEGELPSPENTRVEAHVKLCWECQAQIESWHEATRTLVQYRREIQSEMIPGPPSGWSGFRGALHRAAEEADQSARPWRRTIADVLTSLTRPARATLAVAFTALIAMVLIAYLSPVPSVSATELLDRAVAEEKPVAQKVRIRVRSHQYTREIGAAAASTSDGQMRALFDSAHLDWDRPLSARAFREWRSALAHKTDRISGQNSTWTLETTTEEGPLLAAALTVRASDFHPIHGKLRFAGAEELEITELGSEPAPTGVPVSIAPRAEEKKASSVPEVKEVPVASPAVPARELVNVEAAEMDTRIALFNTGADLGGEIQILPTETGVIVEGIVETAAEKEQLTGMLSRPA